MLNWKRSAVVVVLCGVIAPYVFAKGESKAQKHAKDAVEDKAASAASSIFFPDWGTPSFGFGLGPIAGFKTQRYEDDMQRTSVVQSEFGVQGAVHGVPVVPGNPGVYLKPHAGVAWGRLDGESKLKATDVETDIESKYRRFWLGLETSVFYHWYRHKLDLIYGRRDFSDDKGGRDLGSFTVENDFGVKLVPFISAHYTHRYVQAKYDDLGTPFLREHDNWLHAKFLIELLDWELDFGPGFTFVRAKVNQGDKTEYEVKARTDYLKLVGYFDIFWKLYASVYGKYVYKSDAKGLESTSRTQLPDEGLYQPLSLAMPEDSLSAVELVGLNNVFFGFGVAYQFRQQILNMSEKNGTQKQETSDQGLIITYETRF